MNGEFVRLKQEPGIFSKKIHHHITTRGNDITGLAKANLSKQAIDIHVMVRQISASPLYLRHIIVIKWLFLPWWSAYLTSKGTMKKVESSYNSAAADIIRIHISDGNVK